MTPVHLDLTAYQSMELLETIAAEMSPRETLATGSVTPSD
jgi:hypothetical protein